MGRRHMYAGGAGMANRVKLIHNGLGAVTSVAVAEALAVCVQSGVDPSIFYEVVRNGGGMAYGTYFERRAKRVLDGDFTPTFALELMRKDAGLALDLARAVKVPVPILLDIRLPGMIGLDFLELPAVRDSGVPIVAVSGVATEDQARECLKRGALDFIRKPVTLDRLSAVLAYVEPFARARAESEQERGLDRRPAPRAAVDLAVRLLTEKGVPWESTCTELSASGMKVVTRARLRPGHAVKIAFTPPGSDTPLGAVALVVRADKSGAALWFLDLLPNEVQRLRALVDRLRL